MPTNEQIGSLREVRPQDYDDMSVTALNVFAGAGVLKTLTLTFPAAPIYFGFRPVEENIEYDVPTKVGVLSLYKYPVGNQSELPFTGGSGAGPSVNQTVTGAVSKATAKVTAYSGTWGTGGVLYLQQISGQFSVGETLNLSAGGSCTAGPGILLASIDLEDQAAVGKQYTVKVSQFPATGVGIEGHALPPSADCDPCDQLVFHIDVQGAGGGYKIGNFQPVLLIQMRPDSYAACPSWQDRTPPSAGISNLI